MDGNMDLWMEDCINGGYGHILDRLDAGAKRDVLRAEEFQLSAPNGSSVEIEIGEE